MTDTPRPRRRTGAATAARTRAATRADADHNGIALALAGGGFLGAAYELGALAALAESIDGLDLTRLDTYIGVSAGSYIAAGLANGIQPHQMVRMFIDGEASRTTFDPTSLVTPAWDEIRRSIGSLPRVLRELVMAAIHDGRRAPRSMLWRAAERAGAALPLGLIDAKPAEQTLAALLSAPGRTNDFRRLSRRLRVVATDIDSGQSVEFGSPGFDDVPISRAVAASSAVPGLFSPVKIKGRHFVDGALNKTLHASSALRDGARLVLCVNPLVPFYGKAPTAREADMRAHGTLPLLLSQTIRTAIRSRMTVGLEKYRVTHPQATIMLFEPGADDAQTFSTSIFSLSSRQRLCEHAYQRTRNDLRLRQRQLDRQLAPFGLAINRRILDDRSLTLVRDSVPPIPRPNSLAGATSRLERVLALVDRTVHLAHTRG